MSLLADIESFLTRTNMGAAYMGKAAVGNSELVHRLRRGGRVWPETEARLREFMAARIAGPGSEADCFFCAELQLRGARSDADEGVSAVLDVHPTETPL